MSLLGLVKRGLGQVLAVAGAARVGQYLSAFRHPWDVPAPGARARGFHTEEVESTSPTLGNHSAIFWPHVSTKFTALSKQRYAFSQTKKALP